jgi:hypothetical protein
MPYRTLVRSRGLDCGTSNQMIQKVFLTVRWPTVTVSGRSFKAAFDPAPSAWPPERHDLANRREGRISAVSECGKACALEHINRRGPAL